jgi:hypothetical protein
MKKIYITAAIIATMSAPAFAGEVQFGDRTYNRNNAEAVAEARANAAAIAAQQQGQAQSADASNNGVTQTATTNYRRTVSSPTAPSMSANGCQEAWSAGVTGYWLGVSGGKVTTPDFCKGKINRETMEAAGFGQTVQQQMLVDTVPEIRDAAIAQGVAVKRSGGTASSKGSATRTAAAGVSGANR